MNGKWLRTSTGRTHVVFIHGILSNSNNAWTGKSGLSWPDLLIVDDRFKQLGVYTFEYYTSPLSGSYRLGDVVDALKENLRIDGLDKAERIIFVCHSMGGIVVRKFIVDRQLDILKANMRVGLFLVASPSLGSTYSNFFSKALFFLDNSQLDSLRFSQHNAWLNDLDSNFRNLFQRGFRDPKDKLSLQLFGKELIEDKFIVLKKWWRGNQIVPPFSGATYFGEAIKIPESDHISIAKPSVSSAFQHKLLCQFIEDELNSTLSEQTDEICSPVVKVIVDYADPDLVSALNLYENRIPEEERFESSDIIRWIREDIESRKMLTQGPRDWFLVEIDRSVVRGFALLHYYPQAKFAFFAYLVTARGANNDPQDISHRIVRKLAGIFATDESLQSCQSILLEVDDPRCSATEEDKRECVARLRLFGRLASSMGFSLRIIDFPYKQPFTSIPNIKVGTDGVRMLLVEVVRHNAGKIASDVLSKDEVSERLRFIYLSLYPEGFSDITSENQRYQNYLKAFFAQEVTLLASRIHVLSAAEFRNVV